MTPAFLQALRRDGGEPTIEDLARAFWELDAGQQAAFFEAVAAVARDDYQAHLRLPEHRRPLRLPPDWQWDQIAKAATAEQRDAIREITGGVWLTVARQAWETESKYLDILDTLDPGRPNTFDNGSMDGATVGAMAECSRLSSAAPSIYGPAAEHGPRAVESEALARADCSPLALHRPRPELDIRRHLRPRMRSTLAWRRVHERFHGDPPPDFGIGWLDVAVATALAALGIVALVMVG